MPKANDRIGPYQLIRKLGKGAFGEVWLAKNVAALVAVTATEVALKIPLDDDIDLDAIRQEAAIWVAASGHANVLPILEASVYDEHVIIASEYAPDGSLKDWLKLYAGRAPSIEAAVEMTRGMLAGLEHLHQRNIIHRDLKPDNILLKGTTPRIADFGISRVLKSTSMSAVVAGTPNYMAPEAFSRKRNQQTDVWSVGVILFQMLSGQLPFEGGDYAELYGAIRNEEPEPLPAVVPEWLQQIVAKALAKNPMQRYQTATDMRAALTLRPPRIEEKLSPLNQPQPASPKNLRPAAKWSAGLAVIIIAVVIYVVTRTPSPSSPNFLNSPSNTQRLPDLGETFTEILNGVRLEMTRVPSGSFLMGSPENEEGRYKNEGPQHQVTMPRFYIGKYEVTRAQWKAVMGNGNNPSDFKGNDLPVESVSWNEAKTFCEKLRAMTGKAYWLPSEAEWEYACRAGTTGAYAGDLNEMAWYGDNSGLKKIDALALWNILNSNEIQYNKYFDRLVKNGNKTHSVGQKQANTFQLHDMHGNVWEWCEDAWHDSYGGQHGNPPNDGSAWLTGGEQQYRVLRGGSWTNISRNVRSANRSGVDPGVRYISIGVRVVVSARTQ